MTIQPTLLSGTLRRDAKLLVLAVDGGEQLVLGPASMCGPDLDLRGPGEWAAKILAAYPWVDEFKPEDSDEKYRDGVRYVLLSIECNGSGSDADNQEMKAIRDRWGFS